MFGETPSDPAQRAVQLFKKDAMAKLLELGAGQGRDTIFFAREGFQVWALDYSEIAVKTITQKAQAFGMANSVKAIGHDVRKALPFSDASFDGCYSHMLYCMALTTAELEFLSDEVRRVLRPGGMNITRFGTRKTRTLGPGVTEERICTKSAASSSTFSVERKLSISPEDGRFSASRSLRKGSYPGNCFG